MKGIDKSFFMLKRRDGGKDILFAIPPCIFHEGEEVVNLFKKYADKEEELIGKTFPMSEPSRVRDFKSFAKSRQTKGYILKIAKSKYKKEEYYAKLL